MESESTESNTSIASDITEQVLATWERAFIPTICSDKGSHRDNTDKVERDLTFKGESCT